MIARGAKVVYFFGGTNCINSNDYASTADMIVDYEVMLRKFRRAGIYVITRTLPPRGDWPAGDVRYTRLVEWNAYIASLVGREGIAVLDTRSCSETGQPWSLASSPTITSLRATRAAVSSTTSAAGSLGPLFGAVLLPDRSFDRGQCADQSGLTGTTGTKTGYGFCRYELDCHATSQPARHDRRLERGYLDRVEKRCFRSPPHPPLTRHWMARAYVSPAGIGGYGPFAVGDWVRYGVLVELDNWSGWIALRTHRISRGHSKSGYAMSMGQAAVP